MRRPEIRESDPQWWKDGVASGQITERGTGANITRCCDRMAYSFCVCIVKAVCPEHGARCFGSHD